METLVRVEEADKAVTAAKEELAARRADLRAALRDAAAAGHTYAALGRLIGVGRERVRRMVAEE